jgi:hypothetical protein
LVAAFLGYSYTGIELRAGQISANELQAAALEAKYKTWNPSTQDEWQGPNWVEGSAENLANLTVSEEPYDLIFTCPPYYNKEVYSTDAADGSTSRDYPSFMAWYKGILAQAVERLRENRFVVIVVGDVRNDQSALGEYLNFEADNISLFTGLGLYLYNRAVLYTAIGSLPIKIDKQFGRYRKLGNTHQMVYAFWKGKKDKEAIKEALGSIAKNDLPGGQSRK